MSAAEKLSVPIEMAKHPTKNVVLVPMRSIRRDADGAVRNTTAGKAAKMAPMASGDRSFASACCGKNASMME
jgi:hypothetical protein